MKRLLMIALIGSCACAGTSQELRAKRDEINTIELSFSFHRDAKEQNSNSMETWNALLDQATELMETLQSAEFNEATWREFAERLRAMHELVKDSQAVNGSLSLSAHD